MAKVRPIQTKFWTDTFISDLDPIERYLYLYLFTNRHTDLCGIYELPMDNIVSETKLDEKTIRKILNGKLKTKVYYMMNGWVCVKNYVKYQSLNESVAKSIKKTLENDIPLPVLQEIKRLDTACRQAVDRLCTGLSLGQESNTIDNIYNIIYNYINNKDSNKYIYTLMSQKLACLLYELIKKENPAWYVEPNFDQWAHDIEAIHRLDGRTYEQIEWMIRWTQQDDFWKKNILSPAKLRKQFNNLVVRAKSKVKNGQSKKILTSKDL